MRSQLHEYAKGSHRLAPVTQSDLGKVVMTVRAGINLSIEINFLPVGVVD